MFWGGGTLLLLAGILGLALLRHHDFRAAAYPRGARRARIDAIRQISPYGAEYWSARDLYPLCGGALRSGANVGGSTERSPKNPLAESPGEGQKN